ncbi:hypothetical protein [Gordonia sp. i37]|uniref:hypothetical protein n=1 Tax=Gordonia sp. i37 TaxID=1961707 RepID=UPI00209AFC56|nr:hypothetical protein [Gordonia sp. i37]
MGSRTGSNVRRWAIHAPGGSQGLRDRLDALAAAGPVLLVADDLQWADPESVDALLWLLRRTAGDRLLVAVGTRPPAPGQHPDWKRWIEGPGAAVTITLTGLTRGQVAEMARRRWPSISDELVGRLHEHTGGNPLYLKTLLAEHELTDLSTADVLPAPAAFARTIAARTSRLSDAALAVLRAASVLGWTWSSLALVSAVAEVGEPTGVVEELRAAELVDIRRLDEPLQVRPSHALIRAAVYQQTPLTQLRELHLRAAPLVTSRAMALQHRRAAAARYDDGLADELEAYAHGLYGRRSFRQAAQYLRWAAALTADPAVHERRWLESLYNVVLNYDFATVRAELDAIRMAGDAIWRALVLGRYAIQERRYRDAVAELEPITAEPITSGPIAAGSGQIDRARLRYRAEVLLAWARACLGHPIDLIADGIDRAEMVRPDDTDDGAIRGIELVVAGQVSIRRFGITAVLAQLSGLPAAVAVPLTATGALAFRGSLRATMGLTRAASDDLTEATRRIEDSTDFGAGSFHAQLGFVQWLSGDWGRAALTSRKALDLAGTVVHQLTAAIAPLVDSGAGRFAEADDLIESARELLTESPWEPACLQFVNTLLVRAHAGGSAAEQATALAELRGPRSRSPTSPVPVRPCYSPTYPP